MRASVSMARDGFTLLRRRIAEIEGGLDSAMGATASLAPFFLPRLDRMLHGGLRRDALHEIRSATTRDAAAATGFAVALFARLAASDGRPLLWIVEADAAREGGDPYGAGLAGFGLDPRRLVVVRVKRPVDALWVFEEGLACRGLAGVLAEIRGNPRLLDLTASRRLALRAAAGGGTGLLLRQAGEPESNAALTRWLVAPLSAGHTGGFAAGIGHPAWRLTLERNRKGQTGTIDVEWNHERRAFALAAAGPAPPAHSRPLAPLSPDRPPSPPDARKIVALPLPARQESPLPREIKRRHARSRG
ncbi:hypothetical protein BH10PSE9_BH10PSE9_13860 [soil metagenome]